MAKVWRVLRLITAALVVVPTLGVNQASAWTYDIFESNHWVTQAEGFWCVAASATTYRNHVFNRIDNSRLTQDGFYDVAKYYERGDYPYDAGTDPRGWAAALAYNSGTGYGFNDYRHSTQSYANERIMWSLRDTGQPVGALVAAGHHAVDVVGIQATADPRNYGSLQGFYIVDPWYGRGYSSGIAGIGYGIAPNSYRTLSSWNSTLFLKYFEDEYSETFWNNYYVAVLRKSTTTAPVDYPAAPWGPGASAASAPASFAPEPDGSPTVAEALSAGIAENELGQDSQFGIDLAGAEPGRLIFVESRLVGSPDYWLTEVRVQGKVVALAEIATQVDGFHFSAITPTKPGFSLPDEASVVALYHEKGIQPGNLRAVWTWTDDSAPRFAPYWQAETGNGVRFLSPSGKILPQLPERLSR